MAPVLAERASRWADLRLRVLSASVLAPVTLGCVWLGGWAFGAMVLAAAIVLAIEWRGMSSSPSPLWGGPERGLVPRLFRRTVPAAPHLGPPHKGTREANTPRMLAGIPYLLPGLLALLWLRADPNAGRSNVFFLISLVWASDIGAYAAGRLIGGAKLAPRISPGKTWSGAAGGLTAAIAVAALFPGGPTSRGLLVAALLGVVSQAGDLLESAIKRHFGVKDSGRSIPGHGGLLDRIDGLLAAATAAALLAAWFGRGVELWR